MQKQIISAPTPLFNNNIPINSNFYQPSFFFITALTLGFTTVVTTSVNHNYVVGQNIRLTIPNGYGTVGLNEQTGYVVSIPAANQVEVNINSINQSTFINAGQKTKPQIMAIGSIANGYQSSTGPLVSSTNIPGSFINISPL
jgi:hypothetical protein